MLRHIASYTCTPSPGTPHISSWGIGGAYMRSAVAIELVEPRFVHWACGGSRSRDRIHACMYVVHQHSEDSTHCLFWHGTVVGAWLEKFLILRYVNVNGVFSATAPLHRATARNAGRKNLFSKRQSSDVLTAGVTLTQLVTVSISIEACAFFGSDQRCL